MEQNFEWALSQIKAGKKVGRKEWKNARFVYLVKGSTFSANKEPMIELFGEGTELTYRPHIDMVGADGTLGTWSPSMVDIMAQDWMLIE